MQYKFKNFRDRGYTAIGIRLQLRKFTARNPKFATLEAHTRVMKTKLLRFCAELLFIESSSSPRSISIAQLNTLLHLHLRPIKLVVYERPYSFKMMGYLILRCTSRLDAFSVYHIRTRLPGYALGRTTDAPEVRPTRSSRTKVSSSQISNAHDR